MDETEGTEHEIPTFPEQQPRGAATPFPASFRGGAVTAANLSADLDKALQAERATKHEKMSTLTL